MTIARPRSRSRLSLSPAASAHDTRQPPQAVSASYWKGGCGADRGRGQTRSTRDSSCKQLDGRMGIAGGAARAREAPTGFREDGEGSCARESGGRGGAFRRQWLAREAAHEACRPRLPEGNGLSTADRCATHLRTMHDSPTMRGLNPKRKCDEFGVEGGKGDVPYVSCCRRLVLCYECTFHVRYDMYECLGTAPRRRRVRLVAGGGVQKAILLYGVSVHRARRSQQSWGRRLMDASGASIVLVRARF
ncbi:hypothetical protein B0H19DRAFT_526036 [Mycena capillaripes]|nr:hypothetical protein B0H19DRAFT_526036 [Mycena capillaripes]